MTPPAGLHFSSLVLDSHADTPQRFLDESWSFTGDLGSGQINLSSAHHANLAGEFFVAWVDPEQYGPELYVSRTLQLIDSVHQQARLHPSKLAICTSPDEITAAHQQGRFAMLLAVEGGHSIANSLGVLRCYYQLGVRYMTLTWANSNDWAESSGDLRDPHGLTAFGRDVVREMNRLGMMVDVSHASDRTLDDVLRIAHAPVLASHSSSRALCNSPRNLTDQQIRDIAATGGAVMVNFYSAFIGEQFRQAYVALRSEREAAHHKLTQQFGSAVSIPYHLTNGLDRAFAARIPRPSFDSLMAHFDHILQVAGPDHVGIGTDFDGISSLPEGIDSAADLPRITDWLLAHGYSDEVVRKVLGLNLLRVFTDVQNARQLP